MAAGLARPATAAAATTATTAATFIDSIDLAAPPVTLREKEVRSRLNKSELSLKVFYTYDDNENWQTHVEEKKLRL